MPKIYGYTQIFDDLLVMGSFSVLGSSSTIGTTNLTVEDRVIAIAHGLTGPPVLDSGIMFVRGNGATQAIIWDETNDIFSFIQTNDDHTTTGNINISSYSNIKAGGATFAQLQLLNGATNNFVLTTNTNGLGIWTNPTTVIANGGGVTVSSGTTNYVPRWIGSQQLSSTSSIYDNGANVGIGTASPTARLDIFSSGTSSAANALVIKDSGGVNIAQFRNDAYVQFGSSTKTTSVVLQSAANQTNVLRVLSSSSNEHFGIDSIGNHVGLRVGHSVAGGSFSVNLKDYWFYSLGDAKPALSITGQAAFNQTHVGLGTTASQSYKLYVLRDRSAYNGGHYGQRIEIAGGVTSSGSLNLIAYGLDIQNNGTYTTDAVGFAFRNVGLNVNVGGANINYGILVSGTANNGFGTTTPNAMVHIESSSSNVPMLIASGSSTTDLVRITQVGTGNALVVEDSSNPDSSGFVVDATGNVGIGTASSSTNKLNVFGNANITGYLFAGSASNSYQLSWATASYTGLEGPNVLYVGAIPTTTYTYVTNLGTETYTILSGYFRGKSLNSVGNFATAGNVTHWLFEGQTVALTASNAVHIRSAMGTGGAASKSNVLLLEHSNTAVSVLGGNMLRGLGGNTTTGRTTLFNFDTNGYNAFGTESDTTSALRIVHPSAFYAPGGSGNINNTRGLYVYNPYSFTTFASPGRVKYGVDILVSGTFSATVSNDLAAIGVNTVVSGGQVNIGEQISVTATSSGSTIGLTVSASGGATNIALALNSGSFRYAQSAANGYVLVSDASGFASWTASSNIVGGGGGVTGSGATNYLARWTSSTQLGTGSVYDTGTNVGIGTTSPNYKLEVIGSNNSTIQLVGDLTTSIATAIISSRALFGASSNHDFGLITNGSERLTIKSSGEIGVGTTSPSTKFHISGTQGAFRLQDTTQGAGRILVSDATGVGTWTASSNVFSGPTGSGTTNYLARWTTSTQLGTGSVYDDGSYVGIGTQSSTSYRLSVFGDVNILGTLYATSKSFDIVHPLDPTKRLTYGSLEGPEYGVYVRGKLTNENVISLPDYWTALVDENSITVDITPYGSYQRLFVDKIENNKVYIGSETGLPNCYYVVYAERKDIPKIIVEQ